MLKHDFSINNQSAEGNFSATYRTVFTDRVTLLTVKFVQTGTV